MLFKKSSDSTKKVNWIKLKIISTVDYNMLKKTREVLNLIFFLSQM